MTWPTGKHKLQWVSTTDQLANIGKKNVTYLNLKPLHLLIFVNVQD